MFKKPNKERVLGVKRIELYIYEESIMRPTKYCMKRGGGEEGREAKGI
jgi:hypothetical protein